MISKVKSTKLVEIFFYVSDAYEKELKFSCERFSNNNCPEFTDQEIMTVYLFCISQEQRSKIKYIYNFADEYLRSWKSIGYILEKDIVFIHRIIADSHGLNYYVKYPDGIIWKVPKLAGTDCFYLAVHGKPGGLKTPVKDIDSEELIAAFNGLDRYNNFVLFGACEVFAGEKGKKFAQDFLRKTGTVAVVGYADQASFIDGLIPYTFTVKIMTKL